jgi:hypothetical protein
MNGLSGRCLRTWFSWIDDLERCRNQLVSKAHQVEVESAETGISVRRVSITITQDLEMIRCYFRFPTMSERR